MQIYLIQTNTPEHDSYSEVLGYKTTEAEAQAAVDKLKESYVKAREFMKSQIWPALLEYKQKNTLPELPKQIPYVRFPSGLKKTEITQEMRDERTTNQEQNEKLINEFNQTFSHWEKEKMKFIEPILKPVLEETWFKEWFEITDRVIHCNADGFIEGSEYIYQLCEELK